MHFCSRSSHPHLPCLGSLPRFSQSTQTKIFSNKRKQFPASRCSVHGNRAEAGRSEARGANMSGMLWYSDRSVTELNCPTKCWRLLLVLGIVRICTGAQDIQHRLNPLECPNVCSPCWGHHRRPAWAQWHRDGWGHLLGTWPARRRMFGSQVDDWDADYVLARG